MSKLSTAGKDLAVAIRSLNNGEKAITQWGIHQQAQYGLLLADLVMEVLAGEKVQQLVVQVPARHGMSYLPSNLQKCQELIDEAARKERLDA